MTTPAPAAPTAEPPRAPDPAPTHDLGPFTPGRPRAPWGLRALAVLLDSAVVAAVAFLATGDTPSLAVAPGLGESATADGVAWTAGTLLTLGVLQGYTGMTPGKRVAGVSVVDDRSGRPIGLLGTILRWLAHVLDAFLLIGYLRAAVHREGRTIADSLLGTVAVHTTTPEPHPWVARLRRARDEHAPWLRWPRRVAGGVALVLCAAAAAMSLVPGSSASTSTADDETVCMTSRPVPLTATIGSSRSTTAESRLGITRTTGESWQVVATWSDEAPGTPTAAAGSAAPGALDDVHATVVVRSPDGWVHSSADLADPTEPAEDETWPSGPQPWWTTPGGVVATAVVDSPDDLTGWTATTSLWSDSHGVVAECSTTVPAIDDGPGSI